MTLSKTEVDKVVASSRKPGSWKDMAARGVDIREVEFDNPTSLAIAFAGVDQLLLIFTNAMGEERQRQHKAALEAAKKPA